MHARTQTLTPTEDIERCSGKTERQTVQVLDEHHDTTLQGADNGLDLGQRRLILGAQPLNQLLRSARAVDVERDACEVRCDALDNGGALMACAAVEELLAQIVAERVCHELDHVIHHLVEDHLQALLRIILELLLQEAAPQLIARPDIGRD